MQAIDQSNIDTIQKYFSIISFGFSVFRLQIRRSVSAGLNWTVIIVAVCSVPSYGNCECWCLYYDTDYNRLERWNLGATSFTMEGIGICVRRELDCSGDGTCVRLWIAVVWMLELVFGFEYRRLSVGTCVRLWITGVWVLEPVFGFELQSSECWNLCSALNYSRLNVGTCVRIWITIVWVLELVFGFELQSSECW